MKDIISMLRDLRRPRLLIRAARIGAEHYSQKVHLPRILGLGHHGHGTQVLLKLIEIESEIDQYRRESSAAYDIARHVEVLSAMMAEASVLRLAREQDYVRLDKDATQSAQQSPQLHSV